MSRRREGPPRLVVVRCPDLEDGAPGGGGEGARLRAFSLVVDALAELCPWRDPVRPGMCAFPARGPARYFGGEAAVLARAAELVGGASTVRLGVAEGVFAAELATRCGGGDPAGAPPGSPPGRCVVPAGETPAFLAPWPVAVLGTPDLATVLPRFGVRTLGDYAALPVGDVVGRFGVPGAVRHRVARGLEGELPGARTPGLALRLARLRHGIALHDHQPGFWGGTSEADERAAVALTALQRRLGTEAVVAPELVGGRAPGERVRLVPWRADRAGGGDGGAGAGGTFPRERPGTAAGTAPAPPWPGRLPPPAPARTSAGTGAGAGTGGAHRPAELAGAGGEPVRVTARGVLTTAPARLSVAGGPWTGVTGWSAPWPVEERWWSRAARRAAHLQVTVEGGAAYLLAVERGRWWVAGAYA